MALFAPSVVPGSSRLAHAAPAFDARLATPALLLADPPAPESNAPETPVEEKEAEAVVTPSNEPVYHHQNQFGLSLMPGVGYRIIVPYGDPEKDQISCLDSSGTPGKRVCTSRTPFFLDLQAAFGLSTRIDAIVDLRFGVEKEQGPSRQFMVAPGLRIWLDQDVNVKFYTTIQGVIDSTEQNSKVDDLDIGFRNANGLMYDPIRNVGFFIQFAETFGFKRWFRIELDAGIGVQLRFP